MLLPNDEQIPREFPGRDEPGADWTEPELYPELKPRDHWGGSDYLRLSWEILRRTPRYRWHYHRLERDGLLSEDGFKGIRPYLSSKEKIGLPQWEQIPAWQHYCHPPINEDKQSLGSYVERNELGPWLVVHATSFVKRAWGISEVAAPSTRAASLHLWSLFAGSRAQVITPVQGPVSSSLLDAEMPKTVRLFLSPREAVVTVRLDMPLPDQMTLIKSALKAKRDEIGLRDEDVRLRERITSAPFWLRAWDFEKAFGRRDSARVKRALRSQIDSLPAQRARYLVGAKGSSDFSMQCKIWAETQFEKIAGHATALIESPEGGPFLAHCLGQGLSRVAEGD